MVDFGNAENKLCEDVILEKVNHVLTQQTRDVEAVLVQYLASLTDDGPTLN